MARYLAYTSPARGSLPDRAHAPGTARPRSRGQRAHARVSTAAHDPEAFVAPANARLERWLPHGALLRRAACVVCHGGMGITQKSLAAGVPLCIVPFGRDQFEVGARVAALGAGTCLPPDALSPDSLRTAVQEAIAMREGARTIADAFARAGGAAAAASALEAQLTPAAATRAKSATAPAGLGGGL